MQLIHTVENLGQFHSLNKSPGALVTTGQNATQISVGQGRARSWFDNSGSKTTSFSKQAHPKPPTPAEQGPDLFHYFRLNLGLPCYLYTQLMLVTIRSKQVGPTAKALWDLMTNQAGCGQGLLLPQQPTRAQMARGALHLPDSSDSMLRPGPECGCWSASWAPPHCSSVVRGLKERQRKVRTHSRMRERSTMPSATGGESGSSLTFETGGRQVRRKTSASSYNILLFIYRNQDSEI